MSYLTKKRRTFQLCVLCAAFLCGPALAQEETPPEKGALEENVTSEEPQDPGPKSKADVFEQYRVLIDLIDSVSNSYVQPISREELIQAAIEGVTSKLDPYSYYIANENVEDFRRDLNSSYGGVGMAIDSNNGKIRVVAPLVGMPAYAAGIHGGDEITEIAGSSVEGKKVDDVLKLLSGEIGTSVQVKIRRAGVKDPMEFTIFREMILMETVLGYDRSQKDDSWNYWLDEPNGIAYVHVTEFRNETGNELKKVLKELQEPPVTEGEAADGPKAESPLKGLILDLRFNPGGDFMTAIEMADAFISQGIIVSAKGKNTVEEVWRAKPEVLVPEKLPMVILINSYSASASEVFSACLQDHQRAVIVGERSYGKGIIQSVLPFEGGTSNLKLTTAGYYSPNGRNIHRGEGAAEADEWGVKPEDAFLVQTSTEEDEMLMADMRRRGVLKTHNDLPTTKNPASWCDEQLEKGLGVLESALKTSAKAPAVLKERSAPYREGSESGNSSRRYWRR